MASATLKTIIVIGNELLDGACTWIAKCSSLRSQVLLNLKIRGRINGRQKEEEEREESCTRTGCSRARQEGEEESQEEGQQEEGLQGSSSRSRADGQARQEGQEEARQKGVISFRANTSATALASAESVALVARLAFSSCRSAVADGRISPNIG